MLFTIEYRSKELKKYTTVNVFLPDAATESAPCKTLWLLHGLSDDSSAWVRQTGIERYAERYNLAVVMPNVDRSWYTDTAYEANYFSFVLNELPELCRRTFKQMSLRREDNIVAGLSMGGYGALKLSLTAPERYCACIALSGALDVTRKGRPFNLAEWRAIFGYGLESPIELEGGPHDLFALAEKCKSEEKILPRIYMWCGLEDALIEVNRRFDAHLTSLGIDHAFESSEGDHSWKWWDLHIQSGLSFVLSDN